jgi:hypothetical protein
MASGAKHWSADFVQHLRTVHFALLAAATSLAVLASAPRNNSEARTALPLITQISAICAKWPKDWVEESRPKEDKKDLIPASETLTFYIAPDKLARATGDPGRYYSLYNSSEGFPYINYPPDKKHPSGRAVLQTKGLQGMDVTLVAPGHQWSAEREVTYRSTDSGGTLHIPETPSAVYTDNPPTTLAEFRDWWDNSRSLHVAYFTSWGTSGTNQVWKEDKAGSLAEPKEVDWVEHEPDQNTEQVDFSLRSAGLGWVYAGEVELPDHTRGLLSLQAFGGGDTVVKPWLVAKVVEKKCEAIWRRTQSGDCGSFDTVFPELVAVESELGRLPLQKLTDELVRRASSEPEPFQLAGIKFPIRAMTEWGIVFLLLIQVYLWVHIHEIKGKIDADAPGFDVAWIGVYTSNIARLIFLISLLVPSVAILLLDYYLPATIRIRLIFGVVGGVVSGAVAVSTFRQTPRRTKDTPAQRSADDKSERTAGAAVS